MWETSLCRAFRVSISLVGIICRYSALELTSLQESETVIPSESSIKVAKERRERLRKTGVADGEEYISLSVVKRSEESEGPHPESRLVREEDELGEGDDGMSCRHYRHDFR